jgi:hypothetical protein
MTRTEVSRVSFYSIAMMTVTSVHHIYGALIYNTPWRLQILIASFPMIIFCVIWNRLAVKEKSNFLVWFLSAMIFIFSICLVGGYEGIYNHLLKNILFFAGLNDSMLLKLFPPPTYVMPNDFIFELTGCLQALIFFPNAYYFFQWVMKGKHAVNESVLK